LGVPICKVWAHASLSKPRKLEVFEPCIVCKVLYGMHVSWLNKADQQKLDVFQASCLRKIAGIEHSYVSRVSNKTVRETLGCHPLSHKLLERQLLFLGRIAQAESDNVLRQAVFKDNSIELLSVQGPRRKGRPRKHWINELYGISKRIAGSTHSLANLWANDHASRGAWEKAVKEYCSQLG